MKTLPRTANRGKLKEIVAERRTQEPEEKLRLLSRYPIIFFAGKIFSCLYLAVSECMIYPVEQE